MRLITRFLARYTFQSGKDTTKIALIRLKRAFATT